MSEIKIGDRVRAEGVVVDFNAYRLWVEFDGGNEQTGVPRPALRKIDDRPFRVVDIQGEEVVCVYLHDKDFKVRSCDIWEPREGWPASTRPFFELDDSLTIYPIDPVPTAPEPDDRDAFFESLTDNEVECAKYVVQMMRMSKERRP